MRTGGFDVFCIWSDLRRSHLALAGDECAYHKEQSCGQKPAEAIFCQRDALGEIQKALYAEVGAYGFHGTDDEDNDAFEYENY